MSGERPGESVVEEASMWIRSQSTPFFAWVHMYDPHDPYDAPEPFGSRYANSPYDGEVAYVDAMVGQLRQVLRGLQYGSHYMYSGKLSTIKLKSDGSW